MHRQRFLFPALCSLTFWRFALLPTCELSPAEAMSAVAGSLSAWTWSGTSPLLMLLAKAGMLVGGHTEFGVRFFAPLLALAASMLVWRLARDLFDEPTAAWSVVVLNVIPAFNLAAIHLTPGTVSFAGYAGLALSLAVALRHPARWHRAWAGAAVCMAALVFADAGNAIALAAVVCALVITPAWRSRLVQPEFWMVVAVWAAGVAAWLVWSKSHPGADGVTGWMPAWRIIPNAFRWLLLASPLLIYLLVRGLRQSLRQIRTAEASPSVLLLAGLALPLAFADFGWSVWRAWPDTGHAGWLLFASILLVRRLSRMPMASLRSRVTLRTAVIGLAAVQCLIVMRTDLLRSAGLPWSFAQRMDERRTYTRFLSADPSGALNGWRETAKIVRQVMGSDPAGGWQIVADRWQLAAPVAFYLGGDAKQFMRVFHLGTAGELRRLNQTSGAPDGKTLYLTDDAGSKAVPPELARSFKTTKIISIAEIMHGGHKVRTEKIFACLP